MVLSHCFWASPDVLCPTLGDGGASSARFPPLEDFDAMWSPPAIGPGSTFPYIFNFLFFGDNDDVRRAWCAANVGTT